MNSANRSVPLITILMLFLVLFPIVMGISILTGVDNFPGDDFLQVDSLMGTRTGTSVHQNMLLGLMMGMSVFALFGVYMGGRSNRKLFNDRTIDPINLFGDVFSVAALLRAVFVCHFLISVGATRPARARRLDNLEGSPLLPVQGGINHALDC